MTFQPTEDSKRFGLPQTQTCYSSVGIVYNLHDMLLPNESQSICLSFRKHSLSSKTLRTLAALDVLIRKASAITIGSAYTSK